MIPRIVYAILGSVAVSCVLSEVGIVVWLAFIWSGPPESSAPPAVSINRPSLAPMTKEQAEKALTGAGDALRRLREKARAINPEGK